MFTGRPFVVLTRKLIQLGLRKHRLVDQLLKGAYNLRPPLPRYSSTWDVSLVVSFISGLGDESISLLRIYPRSLVFSWPLLQWKGCLKWFLMTLGTGTLSLKE